MWSPIAYAVEYDGTKELYPEAGDSDGVHPRNAEKEDEPILGEQNVHDESRVHYFLSHRFIVGLGLTVVRKGVECGDNVPR